MNTYLEISLRDLYKIRSINSLKIEDQYVYQIWQVYIHEYVPLAMRSDETIK